MLMQCLCFRSANPAQTAVVWTTGLEWSYLQLYLHDDSRAIHTPHPPLWPAGRGAHHTVTHSAGDREGSLHPCHQVVQWYPPCRNWAFYHVYFLHPQPPCLQGKPSHKQSTHCNFIMYDMTLNMWQTGLSECIVAYASVVFITLLKLW